MGVVYKVEHLRIGKLMAMKLLTGELSRNRDVVRRFKREALAASRLTSVNTVQVWDFGHSDGLTYLVMELVAGEDLGRVFKRDGPLPFRRVAQIAIQVCNSMIEAHDRGIVHRDIKPENILVLHPGGDPDGDRQERQELAEARNLQDLVKVLDFGLAKLHDDERPHQNDVTTTGAIVGTPFYMAPEQIRAEAVDGRADIYGLGAVMYRAITGTPPFTATTPMAVLTQHLTEPLVPPHERAPQLNIPHEASEIIAKAMAKDREERYASAIELREALIGYLATMGLSDGFLRSGALAALAAEPAPEVRPSRVEVAQPVEVATRKEIESYGRERRRMGFMALAVAVVIGVVSIAVARSFRTTALPAHVLNEEVEPNDTVQAATPLILGTPSTGYLGKRIAPDQADADHWSFEVPVGATEPLIELTVTPLPNIPLCVEIFTTAGESIGNFCRPRGRRLDVSALRMQPGKHWLRVTQDRGALEQGAKPPVYENVSDTYSLRVALTMPSPDLEIEPNATVTSAQELTAGQSITAHIGFRDDRDTFCTSIEGATRFVVVDRAAKLSRLYVETLSGNVVQEHGVVMDAAGFRSAPLAAGAKRCIVVRANEGAPLSDDSYQVSVE